MKFVAGLFLCLIVLLSNAQDTIYLKDNNRIIAKILELNKIEVVYKKYDNIEGPTYKTKFFNVKKVAFYNNTLQDNPNSNFALQNENFNINKNDSIPQKNKAANNFLGMNMLSLYSNQFNLFYMRGFENKFFIRFPIYVSTQNKNKYMHPIIDYEIRTGSDFLYKPILSLPIYFGLSANMGLLINNYDFYEILNNPNNEVKKYQPHIYNNWKSYYYGISTTGGYLFQISKKLSIDTFLSMGFIDYTNGYIKVEKTNYRSINKIYRSLSAYAGFNVSYCF